MTPTQRLAAAAKLEARADAHRAAAARDEERARAHRIRAASGAPDLSPTEERLLAVLAAAGHSLRTGTILDRAGGDRTYGMQLLARLHRAGLVTHPIRGRWGLAADAAMAAK